MAEPWTPTPRQALFLAADEDEVLYGGAAGGGKTDAMILDALGEQGGSIRLPEYRALILRRTFAELREVIDRTEAIYPRIMAGATYNQGAAEWRFPTGARIELGYLDRDRDVMRYQSRQFQWIGWEELAQWPDEAPYIYMLSRLRTPQRMPIRCYVRATCNPDGPGARWIAKRFGIAPSGEACSREIVIEGKPWRFRFIPSRLNDNPHLASGYRQQLMQLPEAAQRALLDGRWDEPVVGGAIYGAELATAREERRIAGVPHDPTLKVETYWDLGVGDATVIWFVQSVGREVRLIDFYEASGEGLPHYAEVLQRKGYLYGRHVAPHDISVRELASGRSRLEVAESLGIKFEIAPNVGLDDGIHATRMLFPRLWIDEKRCAPGLEALNHYRKEFNKRLGEYKHTPVHDWSSHAADGLRYLAVSHKGAPLPRDRRAALRPLDDLGPHGYLAI